MKLATLTLLPLIASAAVVQPRISSNLEYTSSESAESPVEVLSSPQLDYSPYRSSIPRFLEHEFNSHHQSLQKRQFWDFAGWALQQTLPNLLRWAADNITWMLKWQESPLKRAQMRPVLNVPGAQKISLKYGPWSLIGSNETNKKTVIQMDEKSTVIVRTLRGLPNDAAILSAKPGLVFEDGSPATFNEGVYIHHFLIADMSKPSAPFALCPNMHKEKTLGLWTAGYVLEAVGAGLVQVGNDAAHDPNLYYTKNGKIRSAFLTNKDDLFLLQAEIVNYNPTNRTVFFTLEMEYLENQGVISQAAYLASGAPMKESPILDASTIVLSAEGCMPPMYMAPPKERKYEHVSEKFEMNQDGWILNARGHLHDGGAAIELVLNETVVCRSEPKYGKMPGAGPEVAETILEMSWCMEPTRIRKGDYLTVKTYYDLDAHAERHGADGKTAKSSSDNSFLHAGHNMDKNGNMIDMKGMSMGNATTAPPKIPNMQAGNGHNMNGGMEGMEEMGIFTTNFAWEVPPSIKPGAKNVTNGFSFGSMGQTVNAGKADAAAKKEGAGLSGISTTTDQDAKEEKPQSQLSESSDETNFGGWNLPYGAISPQTLGAQQQAAAKADRDSKSLMGLLGSFAALETLISVVRGSNVTGSGKTAVSSTSTGTSTASASQASSSASWWWPSNWSS